MSAPVEETYYEHKRDHLAAYGVDKTPEKEITLLAFDPGGTTGYYLASFNPDTGVVDPDSVRYGEMTGRHHGELSNFLRMTLGAHPNLVIVVEDYRPEFGRAQNYVALEYIGVIEGFAQSRMVSLERQGREIKPYWKREKMLAVNTWPLGKPHAQDAARHWLTYASKMSRALHLNLAFQIRDGK